MLPVPGVQGLIAGQGQSQAECIQGMRQEHHGIPCDARVYGHGDSPMPGLPTTKDKSTRGGQRSLDWTLEELSFLIAAQWDRGV